MRLDISSTVCAGFAGALAACGLLATPETARARGMYFDLFATAGYSHPEAISGFTSPTLLQWGGGASLALRLGPHLLAGVMADARYVGQYSDTSASGANYRGTRLNPAAALVGADWNGLVLKASFQFLGNYKLSAVSLAGSRVSYGGPLGLRADALLRLFGRLHGGAFAERVAYRKQVDSSTGDTSLSPAFTLWQFGVCATLVP